MIVLAENLDYHYKSGKQRLPLGRPKPGNVAVSAESVSSAHALRQLSFAIESPSMVALLGPNGSGKSTLFRILTTILGPQKGSAIVCDRDVATDPMGVREQIGIVFQESSLDLHLTVQENLSFSGQLYGMAGSRLRDRISRVCQLLGLEPRLDQLTKTLSGGLRRRVEVARALLHEPRLLLLDEPSTGLDPQGRLELWAHLQRLHRQEGVAVLAVTHFLDEAELCDRILILHQGQLATDGSPQTLREELGGEVVEIVTGHAEELAAHLAPKAGLHVARVGDVVRVECPHGASLIAQITQSHGEWIEELRMRRPSLADVYFHATGALFQP